MSTNEITLHPTRRHAIAALFLGWTASGNLKILSAPRANIEEAEGAQGARLLASFPFEELTCSVNGSGFIWSALPNESVVLEDGTASWARLEDIHNGTIADFSVGITGSGEAVILEDLNLKAGFTIFCNVCRITF